MIDIKYNYLFTLELLHKFYTDQKCADFKITASQKTSEVLSGRKIIAKQYSNKLYAGVQLDNTGKPSPTPEEGMQLTFFLELNNPLFFNYTNLPFSYPSGKMYYFTNRNNNISNGKQFISGSYQSYSGSKTYTPGDLVPNASGTIFQATKTSTGHTPPATNALSDFWMQVDTSSNQNHYMSEVDSVQWLPTTSTYSFDSKQLQANIQVWGYNKATAKYDEVVLTDTKQFPNGVFGFTLNLSQLQPGKYRLNVNGKEQLIYLNDELATKKVFAVVDIFNESNLPPAYKILNAGSLIAPTPAFSIYFLNRSTIWRYVLPTGINGIITDNGGVYKFPVAPSANVYSISPIPLNDQPRDIKLKIGANPSTSVACPSPQRLTNYLHAGDTYYCSEIFINS